MSFGTLAYFTAEINNDLSIRNATKDELVQITEEPVVYEDKCVATKTVKVKNIFDYKVIITIGDAKYTLQPGEEITHLQTVANKCSDIGELTFNIIGYEKYFVHPINVVIDKKRLNPCPPQSDNGQGKPNDNGNGKKCGHKDDQDININKEASLSEIESTVEEAEKDEQQNQQANQNVVEKQEKDQEPKAIDESNSNGQEIQVTENGNDKQLDQNEEKVDEQNTPKPPVVEVKEESEQKVEAQIQQNIVENQAPSQVEETSSSNLDNQEAENIETDKNK